MIIRFLTLAHLMFVTLFAVGQASSPSTVADGRLYDAFTKEQVEFWQKNNTFIIQRYNFYLDHAWSLIDVEADKLSMGGYPEVLIQDLNKINIFLVEKENTVSRSFDRSVTYRVKGQNKLLVFCSEREFNQKLNKALGRSN